ncbi:hypothetical protein D3C80_1508800 [compost metagenome]
MVIVEYQEQRRRRRQMHGQLVEQTVQPFFEGEGLMALAHAQQCLSVLAQPRIELLQAGQQALEKTPGIAIARAKTQPQTVPLLGQCLAELTGQRAFAETRRGADQQQPPAQALGQPLAQARPRHMAGGQWRTKKATVAQRDGVADYRRYTRQIGHHPALVKSLPVQARTPRRLST